MIQKIKLANTEDVLLVKFGTGDVMFHGIKFALGFCHHEPRPIGSQTQEYNGKTTDELKELGIPVRVVFEFTKPESISALIHSLVELQKRMWDAPVS